MLLFIAFLVLTALGAAFSGTAAYALWRNRITLLRWCLFAVAITTGLLVTVSVQALDQVVAL